MTARRRLASAVVAAVVAAVVSSCNVSTNEEPVALRGPFDRVVQSTTTTSTTTPPGGARTVEVYYIRSIDGDVELEPVPREIEADAGVQQALELLIPRTPPPEPGLSTAIPETAVLLGLAPLADNVLMVDTQGLFGQTGVQNPQLRHALGQIVCTATELPSVDAVQFQSEGQPVSASIEDSDVARPVVCSDYDELS